MIFPETRSIERLPASRVGPDVFRSYFESRRPLLIEGASPDVAARWSRETLRARLSPCVVAPKRFAARRRASNVRFEGFASSTPQMTVGEFLKDDPGGASTLYLRVEASACTIPHLFDDFLFPDLFCEAGTGSREWSVHDTYIRIGASSYEYPTHCDGLENLLMQVAESRRAVLYAPEDIDRLYVLDEHPTRSAVDDIDAPDLLRFPEFARARRFEATLHPGDVLYIPALWFHDLAASGWSVSVNRYFRRRRHYAHLQELKPPAWQRMERARPALGNRFRDLLLEDLRPAELADALAGELTFAG